METCSSDHPAHLGLQFLHSIVLILYSDQQSPLECITLDAIGNRLITEKLLCELAQRMKKKKVSMIKQQV